jgi:hypothetical protein
MFGHPRPALTLVILLAACSSVTTEWHGTDSAHTLDNDAVRGDIEISLDDQRLIYVDLIEEICDRLDWIDCQAAVVVDDFSGFIESGGHLPVVVREALSEALGEITYLELDGFQGSDALLLGPIRKRRSDVVAILAGHVHHSEGQLSGSGREYFFSIGGYGWIPITPDDISTISWTT